MKKTTFSLLAATLLAVSLPVMSTELTKFNDLNTTGCEKMQGFQRDECMHNRVLKTQQLAFDKYNAFIKTPGLSPEFQSQLKREFSWYHRLLKDRPPVCPVNRNQNACLMQVHTTYITQLDEHIKNYK